MADLPTRDVRVLRAVYEVEHPVFVGAMRTANATSLWAFGAAAPALWAGTYAFDDARDFRPAYLLTLSEVGAVGIVFALKNTIRRPRPYAVLADVEARSDRHRGGNAFDPYSFPSGHAATSFALATSLSLSFPEWYVIGPAYVYASTVALARVWHGVHYPTDIVVGAAFGTGVALGVHALADVLTPAALDGDDPLARPSPPSIRFSIPL